MYERTGRGVGFAALATIAFAGPAGAQTPAGAAFRADPLLTEQVQAIAQGPDGRVWLATTVGLQVYDGYEVVLFTGQPDDAEAFPRGSVRTLFFDGRDRLWVGHARGLVLLDPIRDAVERVYRHDPDDPRSLAAGDVTAIHEDRSGRLWVGVLNWGLPNAGGLHLLDESTGEFRRYLNEPGNPSSLSHNRVRTIEEDARGDLWIGTWHGLNRLGPDGERFVRYLHDSSDPGSLAYDDVIDLHEDAAGTLWIATIGGGLDRFDRERDAFAHVAGSGNGYLMSLAEDASGRLWIATIDEGLAVLEPDADEIRRVDLGPEAGASGRIDAIGISRDEVLWVAGLASAAGAGRMLRMDLEAPAFTIHDLPDVQVVAEDEAGGLWMGTRGRLARWDGSSRRPRFFDCPGLGPPDALHWLSSIVPGPDGTLWLGHWDAEVGLCRLDPGATQPVPVRAARPEDPPLTWVSDMAWSDDRLWLVAGGSLVGLEPTTGDIEMAQRAPDDPADRGRSSVWNVESDAAGDLWFSTIDGRIRRRRAATGAIDRYAGAIPGQATHDYGGVNSLRIRADGTLWLATDGFGLCEFDPALGGCRRVFAADSGLPSDYVLDVVEDRKGHLWVGSLGTITAIDLASGTTRDLILPPAARGSRLRPGGGTLTADGHVYFGSSVGTLGFHADSAHGNRTSPVARVTRIETEGDDAVRAPRDIGGGAAERLELPSHRNDIVVEYVGIHFADPATNRFAYRLDGLDDDWREVGTERRARFTNLAPGDYVFRVRAASASDVWSDDATFGFSILAPWWRRPWALTLWATLTFGGLAALQAAARRRRELAAALERGQAEARRLSELAAAKSRLFANLSHEYRTPLALILGQVTSARTDVAEAGSAKLDMAERQTRELQRLTDELLEMSRLEAGALEVDWRIADLVPLLQGSVAAFESAARSAGINLRLVVPAHPVFVRHDPDRMRRVVTNLLANALKFTPAGGSVTVEVREPADIGRRARIRVEDTGIGIPPESTAQIFDRFYQVAVAPGAAAGGSGIGLALVRELVELHGGTISVESEVGRGTRFEVDLPAVEWPAPVPATPIGDEAEAYDTNGAPPESDATGRPIVLLVEDHADMRAFLRQELCGAYDIEEAPDGGAGLALAIELVPDLIITDVVMPGMDGYELVRRLRTDERTSHIPIIMLTGRTSDDARIAGLESGVDDYLPKPFSARGLRKRVENLLELRRLLRTHYAGDVWLKPAEVDAPSVDRKFLERVTAVIEQRMSDREFSVEELARAVAMSRSQLHRKLTALLGQSPGALIRSMRLKRAADLIRSDSRTLSQITYDTGFSDQAHFSRSFKKHFGCPPSEFRDQADEE